VSTLLEVAAGACDAGAISALRPLSRRTALRLGALTFAAGVLAACGGSGVPAARTDPQTEPGGALDPDRALRAEAGRAEKALSALYASVAPAFPTKIAAAILALGARHEAYRAAIDPDNLAVTGTSTPAGSAAPLPTSTRTEPNLSTSTTPKAALDRLRAAETDAATSLTAQAVRAKDPDLARRLVLAAAGAAAAAEVLRQERI